MKSSFPHSLFLLLVSGGSGELGREATPNLPNASAPWGELKTTVLATQMPENERQLSHLLIYSPNGGQSEARSRELLLGLLHG